jgi:hypothetical protein
MICLGQILTLFWPQLEKESPNSKCFNFDFEQTAPDPLLLRFLSFERESLKQFFGAAAFVASPYQEMFLAGRPTKVLHICGDIVSWMRLEFVQTSLISRESPLRGAKCGSQCDNIDSIA